jgi:hypothetical protein
MLMMAPLGDAPLFGLDRAESRPLTCRGVGAARCMGLAWMKLSGGTAGLARREQHPSASGVQVRTIATIHLAQALLSWADTSHQDHQDRTDKLMVVNRELDKGVDWDLRLQLDVWYSSAGTWSSRPLLSLLGSFGHTFTSAADHEWLHKIAGRLLLCAREGDVDVPSNGGVPALSTAAHYACAPLVLCLLQAQANPNTRQRADGETALHRCARRASLLTIQTLLEWVHKGLNPTLQNHEGKTAFDVLPHPPPPGTSTNVAACRTLLRVAMQQWWPTYTQGRLVALREGHARLPTALAQLVVSFLS